MKVMSQGASVHLQMPFLNTLNKRKMVLDNEMEEKI